MHQCSYTSCPRSKTDISRDCDVQGFGNSSCLHINVLPALSEYQFEDSNAGTVSNKILGKHWIKICKESELETCFAALFANKAFLQNQISVINEIASFPDGSWKHLRWLLCVCTKLKSKNLKLFKRVLTYPGCLPLSKNLFSWHHFIPFYLTKTVRTKVHWTKKKYCFSSVDAQLCSWVSTLIKSNGAPILDFIAGRSQ